MDYNDVRDLNNRVQQLEQELSKYQSVDLNDINKLVQYANEMQYLLTQCRNEQINIGLAKQIDNLLRQLEG
jgi:hypothetical protein